MLPPELRTKRKKTPSPFVDDHFSLWEDAWFNKMAEERELDDMLDRLFPSD